MPEYPRTFRVRQKFPRSRVEDISAEVHRQLGRAGLAERVSAGQSVAVTAGSRGIANIHLVVQAACQYFDGMGAKPFIIPAMGSHCGGIAEGQRKFIEGYGITEEFCGCPIRASMDTVVIAEAKEGFPIHFDKFAFTADHVLVVGRIKPHTDFGGELQSGLMKMMAIGLGKRNGAQIYHRAFTDYTLSDILRSVGAKILARCNIVGGLAIVENGYDETALLEAVRPEDFFQREPELLRQAIEWLPGLPFRQADLLVIDEIGKNISGTGMDTNVVGRKYNIDGANDEWPKIKRIIVRSLTPETKGNAAGIGIADFCTREVIDAIDHEVSNVNTLTSGNVKYARIPIHLDTDAQTIGAALKTVGLAPPADTKLIWIANTLHLTEVECSEVYLDEARQRDDLEVLTEPRDLPFDESGSLSPVK